jgi:chitodextrinase
MISPWMVGAIGTISGSDDIYNQFTVGDQADCAANGIDYQPCVLPGDVSGRQRVHGDFMWRQFYNMCRAGVAGIYISMFDEFNEGNQITKTAENQSQMPTNSGLLALDEDGTACSSDYYLRLTGDGGRMLKGQIALTATRPTQPVVGGGTDTTAPSVPASLAVTGHTSSSVSLSWAASTDNVAVTGYQIRQSGVTVASTGSTSFTVTGLAASTTYSFAIAAYDAANNVSAASATVNATTDAIPAGTNVARNKPTAESSHNQTYASGAVVDGDQNSYWESVNNAFPQWVQVDLQAATALSSVVLKLPATWGSRQQTIALAGSNDGSTWTPIKPAIGYTFDPASANTVTVAAPRCRPTPAGRPRRSPSWRSTPEPRRRPTPRRRPRRAPSRSPATRRRRWRCPGPARPTTSVSPATRCARAATWCRRSARRHVRPR